MTYVVLPQSDELETGFEKGLTSDAAAWLNGEETLDDDVSGSVSEWLKSEQSRMLAQGLDYVPETIELSLNEKRSSLPISYEGNGELYQIGDIELTRDPSAEGEFALRFTQLGQTEASSLFPLVQDGEIVLMIQVEGGYDVVKFGTITDIDYTGVDDGALPKVKIQLHYPQVTERVTESEPLDLELEF